MPVLDTSDALPPHAGGEVTIAGPPLGEGAGVMILTHGRGAVAKGMIDLARVLDQPRFTYIAPQASGNTWYPFSFLAPMEQNEPGISSGLSVLGLLVTRVVAAGVPADRIMLLGFSQGACLTLEFVARNPRRYGGVAALSGGVIGPPGTPRDYPGSLDGTPVFLGCSDVDAHIPLARVHESGQVMERLGAAVDVQIYPGMGHTVSNDEVHKVREMMTAVAGA
jgi:predicted esterase